VVVAVLPELVVLAVLPELEVVAMLPEPVVFAVLPEPVVVAVFPVFPLPVLLPERSGCCACLHAQLAPLVQLQGRPEASYTEGCVSWGQVGAVSQSAPVAVVVAVSPEPMVLAVLPELVVLAVLPEFVVLAVLPEVLLPVALLERSGFCACLHAQLAPLAQLQGRPEASYTDGCVSWGQVGAVSQSAPLAVVVAVSPELALVAVLPELVVLAVLAELAVVAVLLELVVLAVLPEVLLPVALPERSGCCACLHAQLTPSAQLQGRPEASYVEGCVSWGQVGAVSQSAPVMVAVLPEPVVVAVLPVPVGVAGLLGLLLLVLLPLGGGWLRQAHLTPLSELQGRPAASYSEG
jgi:hypothetical protein